MGNYQVKFDVTTNDAGKKTYVGEMRHEGLGKHRIIRDTGENEEFARLLTKLQWVDWEQRFENIEQKKLAIVRRTPQSWMTFDEGQRNKADALTQEIQNDLKQLETILVSALDEPTIVNWNALKARFLPFSEDPPKMPAPPTEPMAPTLPTKPSQVSWEFQPALSILDKLISSRRDQKIAEAKLRYEDAVSKWQSDIDRITEAYQDTHFEYKTTLLRMKSIHAESMKMWETRKADFEIQERLRNSAIDAKQAAYLALEPTAIVDYCDLVLYQSHYPDLCPKEWELDYDPSSKQLIVDYLLPAPDDFPKIKGVKWVSSRKVFEDQKLTETAREKLYDEVVYQIILRTAHEIVSSDAVGAIHAVVVNGIVNSIDRGTGKVVTACILSLRVEAAQFRGVNLAQVDPKTCFKSLKGVGSSRLHGLSPIPPIMTIRKDDARFVSAYGVADSLDSGVNLAAMGWEDFEHLIRELFEKEFSSNGGEVRVTQASRDGGVDAIAFDPDPIRGGKIVIQAKRYTNTVGVSAVRDLYGTVLNEGATKGVLVTTSDYGPDSYSFAQGKPLVLLSGANLLHMLQKHGHKAKIDLREAKQLIAAQEK